jgi:hypothetical protein
VNPFLFYTIFPNHPSHFSDAFKSPPLKKYIS